jgi:hypothetical protein
MGNHYIFTQTKSQTNVYQSIKIIFTRHFARRLTNFELRILFSRRLTQIDRKPACR